MSGEGRVARHACWVYLAATGALTLGYALAHLLGPTWLRGGLVFNLIGGASVAALIIAAHRNSGRSRLPLYLLAVGQGLFVTSDVLAYNYERLFGEAMPFPSIADAFHLAFYPFLLAGMLLLIRERGERRDRSSLIDAMIVTVALAALLWVYLIAPFAGDHALSLLARATSVAYPAMDILLLGVVARLAAGSHRREPAWVFLLSATIVLLISDATYGWSLLEHPGAGGAILESGWAVYYVLLGAAALHPSMRQLAEPGPERDGTLTRARLALLACASMTVPLVIVVRDALGEPLELYVLIGASALMFALVLARMAGMAQASVNRRSEERLGALIRNASDVVCIIDAEGALQYVSPSLEPTFGYPPETLDEGDLTAIVHPDEAQRVRSFVAGVAAGEGAPVRAEFRIRHARGSWREVEALATNQLADEAIAGVVLNIRDISERRAFQAELEHQSFHDDLTGLPNRALFCNRVAHALAGQRRDRLPVAILLLDIDDFKNVNDGLGPAAGDSVLQEIARRLEDCMRPVDTAARLGGDEFAILIDEARERAGDRDRPPRDGDARGAADRRKPQDRGRDEHRHRLQRRRAGLRRGRR